MPPPRGPDDPEREAEGAEVKVMKRERIQKPKPRVRRDVEPPMALDPRDPDVVRVKRALTWRFADRRWAV
jgi:hypothetical protein